MLRIHARALCVFRMSRALRPHALGAVPEATYATDACTRGVGLVCVWQAMLKFENNAGTLDHKDPAFEKPVLLSVIIKVRPSLCHH